MGIGIFPQQFTTVARCAIQNISSYSLRTYCHFDVAVSVRHCRFHRTAFLWLRATLLASKQPSLCMPRIGKKQCVCVYVWKQSSQSMPCVLMILNFIRKVFWYLTKGHTVAMPTALRRAVHAHRFSHIGTDNRLQRVKRNGQNEPWGTVLGETAPTTAKTRCVPHITVAGRNLKTNVIIIRDRLETKQNVAQMGVLPFTSIQLVRFTSHANESDLDVE